MFRLGDKGSGCLGDRKGEQRHQQKKHVSIGADNSIVMFSLNNVFNFQFSSHNNYFLVVFANSLLRNKAAWAHPKLFGPVSNTQGLRRKACKVHSGSICYYYLWCSSRQCENAENV